MSTDNKARAPQVDSVGVPPIDQLVEEDYGPEPGAEDADQKAMAEAALKAAGLPPGVTPEMMAFMSAFAKELMAGFHAGMTGLIEEIHNTGPVKQVPFAKHSFVTPWNPKGSRVRPALTRSTYQNNTALNPKRMNEAEILLFNKLRAGRYCDGTFTVLEVNKNGKQAVSLLYSDKSLEQRIALAKYGRRSWREGDKPTTLQGYLLAIIEDAERQKKAGVAPAEVSAA